MRDLSDAIRIPGDDRLLGVRGALRGSVIDGLFLNDLLVQEALTPGLAAQVNRIAGRVGLSSNVLRVFIYASPYLQAECRLDGGAQHQCALRISSALVEALSEEELDFVIGHELGHFLLGHLAEPSILDGSCLETAMIHRRRELSADRMGFLACQSVGPALSAMIKTVSGLSLRHLKIDTAAFISQLHEVDATEISGATHSSHPAFILRCRALLWFSLAVDDCGTDTMLPSGRLDDANRRVLADLLKYVERPIMAEIEAAQEDLEFWTDTARMVESGSLSRADQRTLASRYGVEMVDKLKEMLMHMSPAEAITECLARVREASSNLKKMAPRLHAQRFAE